MKITHILHPEIVSDQRGDPSKRKKIKDLLRALDFSNDKFCLSTTHMPPNVAKQVQQNWSTPHSSLKLFMVVLALFKFRKGKTFYLPSPLFEDLSKTEPAIKSQFLPEYFIGYVAFAEDNPPELSGGKLNGAYVRIAKADEDALMDSTHDQRKFSVVFIYEDNSEEIGDVASCNFCLVEDKLLSDVIPFNLGAPSNESAEIRRLCNVLLNAILIITHQSEAAIPLRPAKHLSLREREILAKDTFGYVNLSTARVHLLNPIFQGKKIYTVDETSVRGHFRWQPHGPGFSQIKLIWISEHVRKFGMAGALE